jgi:hypothetical protein
MPDKTAAERRRQEHIVIENTSNQYGPFDLPILGGSASAIERMEADGQRQVLESCDLPTEGSDDPEFLRLGFTFGEPHKDDPLFRPATLPKGWKRAGTDHSMHTKIVDELGRERVGVFYKAAFYDRQADMCLTTVSSYVSSLLYYGRTPVLDDEWANVEAVTEAARKEIARSQKTIALYERPDVAERAGAERAAEAIADARAEIAKAEALIAQVTS